MTQNVGRCPLVSIVVPVYNGAEVARETIRGLLAQAYANIELILVDDCSSDGTRDIVREFALQDDRLRFIVRAENGGTLQARRTGVLASRGDYVTFVDQDDELEPYAIERLVAAMEEEPVDSLHFAARVAAENPAAEQAAAGMQGFLTPPARALEGKEILRLQFAEQDGFDWHVHHKLYRGDFIRNAYAKASDAPLAFADDGYMSFIICAEAESYRALADAPYYVYHLGRGETFGAKRTVSSLAKLSAADAKALLLVREYANTPERQAVRTDWAGRVADFRDRQAEHVMNEWKDNVSDDDKPAALDAIRADWPADCVAAELYRYVRDYAYELWVCEDGQSGRAVQAREQAMRYWALAREIEGETGALNTDNKRYAAMRDIAYRHLRDTGLCTGLDEKKTARKLHGLLAGLFGRKR